VPAAAVIPAPIAYTKFVAVKKLVVGFLSGVMLWVFDLSKSRCSSWEVAVWALICSYWQFPRLL
jgi:hypothetical protein